MQVRLRRQSGETAPEIHGDHLFLKDRNRYARIHYSGNASPVSVSNTPTHNNIIWHNKLYIVHSLQHHSDKCISLVESLFYQK